MQYKFIIFISIGLIITTQPSYIHPDEHFQSLEILSNLFFNIKGTIPWEFNPLHSARSYVPLLLNYSPFFLLIKSFPILKTPSIILYGSRLINLSIFLLTIFYILNLKKITKYFILTSFVTFTLQSHTFSNSLETIILLWVLNLYSKNIDKSSKSFANSIWIGTLISLGVFNRMTFPAFILLPSIYMLFTYYAYNIFSLIIIVSSFLTTSCLCILIDSKIYGAKKNIFIITPLNNFLYNLYVQNLKLHGLHAWYTHLLINLPQLVGPLIIILPWSIFQILSNIRQKTMQNSSEQKRKYFITLSSLSLIGSLMLLSLFKHQELRFLTPLMPLIIIVILEPFTKSKYNKFLNSNKLCYLKISWILFNFFMSLLLGCFHQTGIIKYISTFQSNNITPQTQDSIGIHIWWKTYSPPTWMYLNQNLIVSTTTIKSDIETIDDINFDILQNHIIDLKGSDINLLNDTLHTYLMNDTLNNATLILPRSVTSKLINLKDNFVFTQIYSTNVHLDLDHIDFDDLSSLYPGLIAYSVRHK
ncbi:hypothetical protein TBLA_0D01850 [Henningerozyma blattae CBS 6284]|uniref:Mannosyltransferase n=1 Tax=Henningerozyma blattae (strain ATCC 34711 / CBS 6284 / DSM 70876 / NBRC 10599 / NRRL Y-10934 / UCD 77-7) TaxID=1071380 RepID=I2H2U0_HENB6|nr:hypothetical protein TBLA_0D01850 [Tetrapisispora blattae CBS 6284]CCH60692.1 hypothetical protein TBLA_0D01850 [Tetrapisispora blattae CBS 6284]